MLASFGKQPLAALRKRILWAYLYLGLDKTQASDTDTSNERGA